MVIFSRRLIQQWLQENLSCVGAKATRGQVTRLNDTGNPRNVIGAVWEIASIWALRQLGTVNHESGFGIGTRKPDLHFKSLSSGLEFLVDITAVSDEGLHEINWVTELRLELMRLKIKFGIGHLNIRTDFGRISDGEYGDRVVRVALPSKRDRAQLIKAEFVPFIRLVASAPSTKHIHHIKNERVDILLTFDPEDTMGGAASYPSYTTPHSLTNNPVFNALAKKRSQLKGSGFEGIRGVILCDGGCGILQHTGYSEPEAYRLDQIVAHFLNSTASVHFVLTVGHAMHTGGWTLKRSHELIPTLFLGPSLRGREPEFQFLLGLPRLLPKPVQTAGNAFPKHVNGREPSKLSQEYKMAGDTIEIDAGDLLGLLSGTIDQADWLHEPVFTDDPVPFDKIPKKLTHVAHAFKLRLERGQRLKSIRIVERENKDHDMIAFEFGDVDPAKGEFQLPSMEGGPT